MKVNIWQVGNVTLMMTLEIVRRALKLVRYLVALFGILNKLP